MIEEAKDKAETIKVRLGLWWNAFAGLYIQTFPFSVILTGVVFFGLITAWLTYHGTSEQEQEAQDAGIESVLSESNSNVADKNVANKQRESDSAKDSAKDAGKVSQNASKEREKAIQTDSSEGKDRDAQARFCERFPNDSTCQ